jgi:hypothetical protein
MGDTADERSKADSLYPAGNDDTVRQNLAHR